MLEKEKKTTQNLGGHKICLIYLKNYHIKRIPFSSHIFGEEMRAKSRKIRGQNNFILHKKDFFLLIRSTGQRDS